MDATESALSEMASEQAHIFRKALPLQVALHEVRRALGSTDGQSCLEIGAENGQMSQLLRQSGGRWQTVVADRQTAEAVGSVIGDDVTVFSERQLPFKKKTFDAIVVLDYLERSLSAEEFIEECHRLLKPDGRLIVHARHQKSYSIVPGLRRMCGLSPENRGRRRYGYTETELFGILKNGFNVLNVRSYSRFFVQVIDAIVQMRVRRHRLVGTDAARRRRTYSIAGPFYRIAFQLDMLLFLTRGHFLIASAKRRAWRPRDAPVLVDGRSISEAVLSRPSS